MSTQTVYFNNPSSITTLQGQVGVVAGQVNTTTVNATTINPTMISSFNTTGAINNLSVNRFVDKYTINNGLGPYKVDAVPICFRDTFAMPKFSNNLSTTTGAVGPSYSATGVGGYHYTEQLFDTFVGHDIVVYLPSARTTMETTPVFKETVQGECDNLGSFGITLADFNGPLASYYNTADQWTATLGSSTLGALFNTFYALGRDPNSTTGARTTALNAIYADPDYATIKNRFKYPFKIFDQIKSGSDFQFEQLYSLSGAALINTGTDGTQYPTQITSTTYAATGNLLPVASNANAISNQMGLFIFHMGDGNNIAIDTFAHQVASWGYAVAYIPGTPMSSRTSKFGLTKNIAKMLADRDIPLMSATGTLAGYFFTGGAANVWAKYDSTVDNNVSSAAGVNGFWRNGFRQMFATAPAQLVMERYYYQIRCVLEKLGVGRYINYNNVVVGGISGGGYANIAISNFLTNGLSTQYRINGGYVPLFRTKAFIGLQPNIFEFSQKIDAAAANNNNIYNNRYAVGIKVLPCPFIAITTDGDTGNTVGMASPLSDFRYNHQLQTMFQCTKQAGMVSGAGGLAAVQNLARSAVFYKPGTAHTDIIQLGTLRVGDGQYSASIYNESYYTEWKNGWYLNLNPQWPAIDNVYESGLQNEIAYTMTSDIKINTLIELMAHRFLGNDYPVPQSVIQSVGIKADIAPTHCDVITETEYLRVGPLAQMSYDDNYNIVLKNNPNVATATQSFNVVATGSNGLFKGISASTTFAPPSYTIAQLTGVTPTITPTAGQVVTVSDSGSGSPGQNYALAYANGSLWYYMFNNSAV
jgi:hypothetical protein